MARPATPPPERAPGTEAEFREEVALQLSPIGGAPALLASLDGPRELSSQYLKALGGAEGMAECLKIIVDSTIDEIPAVALKALKLVDTSVHKSAALEQASLSELSNREIELRKLSALQRAIAENPHLVESDVSEQSIDPAREVVDAVPGD